MNKTINPTVDILDCNGNSYGRVFSTQAALAAAKVMAQQYLVSLDVRTKEGQLLFTVEPVIHARVIWKSDEAPELSGINLKVKKDAAAK